MTERISNEELDRWIDRDRYQGDEHKLLSWLVAERTYSINQQRGREIEQEALRNAILILSAATDLARLWAECSPGRYGACSERIRGLGKEMLAVLEAGQGL